MYTVYSVYICMYTWLHSDVQPPSCIKWTIGAAAALSISESDPSTSALAPINSTQQRYSCTWTLIMFCISSVFLLYFVFSPQNFVAFVCIIHSTDVHHLESQPSIWHFHGFQVIANWRLAQIARTLDLLQKSKQKIRNSDGMRDSKHKSNLKAKALSDYHCY